MRLSSTQGSFERDISNGLLQEDVARWNGEFLAVYDDAGGEAWHAWLAGEREGLRTRLAWAMERLCDDAAHRGDWSAGLRLAEQWSTALPLDQRASRRLSDALRLAGRVDEALARHASFSARYREAIGHDPPAVYARLRERLRQDAAHETARARRPRGPGSVALLSPDFVGRSEELATLADVFARVAAGGGAVVLVEGDEGMGKTRLAEEFGRWVRTSSSGTVRLAARAFEAEADRPWTTGRHLFAQLADEPGIAGCAPQALARLADVLMPSLRERCRSLPPAGFPDNCATATVEALVRALADVAEDEAFVISLDDFPSADPETQAVLRALIRRPLRRVLQLYTGTPEALDGLRLGADLFLDRQRVDERSRSPSYSQWSGDEEKRVTPVPGDVLRDGLEIEVVEQGHPERHDSEGVHGSGRQQSLMETGPSRHSQAQRRPGP